MRLNLLCWSAFLAMTLTAGTSLAEGDFPGRTLYPTVSFIEIDDLDRRFDQVTIVDVRSKFEYETLHIKGARHIALAGDDFVEEAVKLYEESGKPLVFYCNGRTCEKSYRAALKAERGGISGSATFDAGILDWARAHPDRAVLLGESPIDPAKLIGKEKFEAHLLEPMEFARRIGSNGKAVDARDRFQRDGVGLFVGREKRAPFDNRAEWRKLAAEVRKSGEALLIYDAVGKQVRWLQYLLEDLRVREYYFMKGGAKAFYNALR